MPTPTQDQPGSTGTLPGSGWSPALRIGFRFCVLYFGMYCAGTQVLTSLVPIPDVDIPDLSTLWPMRQVVFWTASHVFHFPTPLIYKDSGSGDKVFDWVFAFCVLVLAVLATGVWSALDRRRADYRALHAWFRLALRFLLAGQMMTYGLIKVFLSQMPFPSLRVLVEPFGDFSPMGVLWSSIGASPAYETFAGCAELLAGVLLVIPRTAMVGALLSAADMTQVFMLNMTYDVPVKLLSFHLLGMSLVLLAPDASRLVHFLVLNRAVGPSSEFPLFPNRRANRRALVAQLSLAVVLLAANAYGSWTAWSTYGGGRPKSALYGVWDVDEFSSDGQLRPPLLTDPDRWRRAIFDSPTRMSVQRMDASFASYGATLDLTQRTVALTQDGHPTWKAGLSFQRDAPDRLTLEGEMDGHRIHAQLHLFDRNKFLLVNRGFHWIQDYPFNR